MINKIIRKNLESTKMMQLFLMIYVLCWMVRYCFKLNLKSLSTYVTNKMAHVSSIRRGFRSRKEREPVTYSCNFPLIVFPETFNEFSSIFWAIAESFSNFPFPCSDKFFDWITLKDWIWLTPMYYGLYRPGSFS